MTRVQSAFYHVFIIAVLAAWAPSKLLPYLVPFFGLSWLILWGRKRIFMYRLILLGVVWVASITIGVISNRDFVLQNAIISFVTYGTFYIPFIVPSRYLYNPVLYQKIAFVLLIVIALEAPIGIAQATYGFLQNGTFDIANGDRVQGTINLSFSPSGNASNRIFATNMALALIAVVPYIFLFRKWRKWLFLAGAAALVLASVVHILYFLIISMVLALLVYHPEALLKSRRQISLLITIVLIFMCAWFLLPNNMQLVQTHFQQIRNNQNPKMILLSRIINEVPKQYPASLIIGLGPGQFASRAGLISTGMYFGGPLDPKPLPLISPSVTPAIGDYLMDLWLWVVQLKRPAGSSLRPFSSWLAMLSEFGLMGFMLIAICVWIIITRKVPRGSYDRMWAFSFVTGVTFLFLIGIQEFYWETPQMLLPGVLALKAMHAQQLAS